MPSINNNRKDVVQELLLQVYMKLPNCLIHLTSSSHGGSSSSLLLPSEVTSFGNTSVAVDCISHTILSALAATQHGRSWVRPVQGRRIGTTCSDFSIVVQLIFAYVGL